MLESVTLGIEMAITLVIVSVGLAGWEWRKLIVNERNRNQLSDSLKRRDDLQMEMLRKRDKEQAEVMEKMTIALRDLHTGIAELTHYIKWLGEQQTGQKPPPRLSNR